MNFELFIARKIVSGSEKGFSKPIVKLAITSIALGLSVMLVSISIILGFKNEIRDKVIGFDTHLQIVNYDNNYSFESLPIDRKQDFLKELDDDPGVKHVQVFAQKAGLIKTDNQIQGVLVKGVTSDYDWSFIKKYLVAGEIPSYSDSTRSNEVMISQNLADRLGLKLHDDLRVYFVSGSSEQPRGRKFQIEGIYNTGLGDVDKLLVFSDLKHIQRLNNWKSNQISGFEIELKNFDQLDQVESRVYRMLPYDLRVDSIVKKYIGVFLWLDLLNTNVYILLALMIMIGVIAMVSTLLILILERTNMIGVLKALGCKSLRIRKIFIYNAAFIIGKGMLYGNLVGLSLLLIQKYTGIFKLDPIAYFVDRVPVDFNLLWIIGLNIGTLVVCTFFMLFPSYIIGKISPSKAIRFK